MKHSKTTDFDPRIERDEKVAQKAYASSLEISGGNLQRAKEARSSVRLMRQLRRSQEDVLKQVAINNEKAFRDPRTCAEMLRDASP